MKTAIPKAKKRAVAKSAVKPVVPGTMAGYSGTPLPKKLGIRENCSVALMNAPEAFERKLRPLPEGAQLTR